MAATVALLALALFAGPAWAVSRHVFDPDLSLTGTAADPGSSHPLKGFEDPCGTAVDRHGDVYVASPMIGEPLEETKGRIDIFNPSGEFLTEIEGQIGGGHGDAHQPCSLAVDSEGDVYVAEYGGKGVALFKPEAGSYPPHAGSSYGPRIVIYEPQELGSHPDRAAGSVAVDPSNDHLFVGRGAGIIEYSSAHEGSAVIREIGHGDGIDVYAGNHDVYATNTAGGDNELIVFDGTSGNVKCEIDGSETPSGGFGWVLGSGISVDQANGDVYVDDIATHHAVDQFSVEGSTCKYIGRLPSPPNLIGPEPRADIAVDDPYPGEELGGTGYDSPNEGEVFVTSGRNASNSHLYAFAPAPPSAPPQVRNQAVAAITETEAVLSAELNPTGIPTTYRFEYTTAADYAEAGYAHAARVPVPDGNGGEGGAFVPVSAPVAGLEPGTAYRFRLVATSHCQPVEPAEECITAGAGKPGEEGADATFSTYPSPALLAPCPNEMLRTGASALLSDCRAYELVTPPDTNGRIPTMTEVGASFDAFDTPAASPDGESLVFGTEGGSLPGTEGGGFHDTYEALREEGQGWSSHFTGLSGAQAREAIPGGISADHRYSFWEARGSKGSLATGATNGAHYLRNPGGVADPKCAPPAEPGGMLEVIGCGSLGQDATATGKWIGPSGSHVIFATNSANTVPKQLEPCAPPTGVVAIYDRTPGGPTRCVSVAPEAASPATKTEFQTTKADYLGVSEGGGAVVFRVGETTYVRLIDESRTVELATGKALFAGISRDDDNVFYLREPSEGGGVPEGDLFACDVGSGPCAGPGAQAPTEIAEEATPVNVSVDGSHVYFVSTAVLPGAGKNQREEEAKAGSENLYAWDESGLRFVAVLDPLDVSGEETGVAGQPRVGGLGLWVNFALTPTPTPYVGPAVDPSRTTPDGRFLVFQSHADLTAYESHGRSEIYRYDAGSGGLLCLSCNPTGAAASSSARFESDTGPLLAQVPPVNALTRVANVTDDGSEVFFQSGDRLTAADNDGKVDVYEWQANNAGACRRGGGCIYLISSGHSASDNYLYAVTPDGRNVFFETADILAAQDPDGTPSIYDARVDGGFPVSATPSACEGEACRLGPQFSPPLSHGSTGPFSASQRHSHRRCRKGARKVHPSAGCSKAAHKHRHKHHRHKHRGRSQ